MAIHSITVLYEPNTFLTDNYIPGWLRNWTAWSGEQISQPQTHEFTSMDSDRVVEAEGFISNRFELQGENSAGLMQERDIIFNALTGSNGFLAQYADWYVVKWHHCVHDGDTRTVERTRELSDGSTETYTEEVTGCGSWEVIEQKGDVPDEVPV